MMKFILMIFMMMVLKKNHTAMIMLSLMFNISAQSYIYSKMSYFMMTDYISFWMINLSTWVIMTTIILKQKLMLMYKLMMTSMVMTLILTFSAWNFIMFYIMFEIAMIKMIMLIIMWSYQPERTEAATFMLIMTIAFSLPFFACINKMKIYSNFSFNAILPSSTTFMIFMFMFLVKIPMFFMHMWLPKAHVESPVFGSMILAAIMLKLGSYGIMRMSMSLIKFKKLTSPIMAISIWTMFILSMMCITMTDLKAIIAYSSIIHMMMMVVNLTMYKQKSINASMVMMLGHGLCSSAMFFSMNLMYKASKSRSIMMNKGILNYNNLLKMMWFILCMNNTPMPPSMNLMAEIMLMKSIISWAPITPPMIMAVMFYTAMYSIYIFYITAHSKFNSFKKKLKEMTNLKHTIVITIHIFPMMVIMVKPQIIMI